MLDGRIILRGCKSLKLNRRCDQTRLVSCMYVSRFSRPRNWQCALVRSVDGSRKTSSSTSYEPPHIVRRWRRILLACWLEAESSPEVKSDSRNLDFHNQDVAFKAMTEGCVPEVQMERWRWHAVLRA